MTLSIRESNWLLYLFTLRRAMPLFFAFVPSNFSWWVLPYFNFCILIEETYPDLFEGFMNVDFTVQQSKRKCSAIPIDQALEKKNNNNWNWWSYYIYKRETSRCQVKYQTWKKYSISNSLTNFTISQSTVNINYITNFH